ncbi:MAG: hypothetical protein R6V84_18185 [Desulfobacterales bacterium]
MSRQIPNEEYRDCYEYHGSTMIEHIRRLAGETVWRDWILFDTAEEAADYFYAACGN